MLRLPHRIDPGLQPSHTSAAMQALASQWAAHQDSVRHDHANFCAELSALCTSIDAADTRTAERLRNVSAQ